MNLQQDFEDVPAAVAVPDEPELPGDQQQVEKKGPRAQRKRTVDAEDIVYTGNGGSPQCRTYDQHNTQGQEIQPEDEDRVSF